MQAAQNKRKHGATCAAGEHEHSHDQTSVTRTTTEGAGTDSAVADGVGATLELARAQPANNEREGATAGGVALVLDEAAAKAASTKLTWSQALQRAS